MKFNDDKIDESVTK